MATIAALAIKVSANISDLTKGIKNVNSSIGYMVKTAQNATPSIKSLENVSQGLAATLDSVSEAQKRVNNNPLDIENQQILTATTEAAAKLQQEMNRIGSGVSDDILKMRPTVENVFNAQRTVEQLKAKFGEISPIVRQAEQNVAQLTARASETEMQMDGLRGTLFAINQLPFTILMSVFRDMWEWVSKLGSEFNERWNGLPGIILKVVASIAALVVVIGLAFTNMAALGGQTSYFMALWNSSLIVQGVTGFATMLGGVITYLGTAIAGTITWIAAQWNLNVAMYANPIGIIVAAIAVAVALMAALVAAVALAWRWWANSAKAAEDNKKAIAAMETSTAAFRDRVGEAVDRYKELNNLAKQYHEANLSGAQKYQNKLKEIDEVMNKQNVANSAVADWKRKETELVRAIGNAKGNKDMIASLQKQLGEIRKDRTDFIKNMKNAPALSAADAAAAKESARLEYLKGQYGNLLEAAITPQELYQNSLKNLAADLRAGFIRQDEYNTAVANAKAEYEKNDPALQAARKAQEDLNKATQELVDKFRGMVQQSPVEAFNGLTAQLNSVKSLLTQSDFSAAQQKLLSDLANTRSHKSFPRKNRKRTTKKNTPARTTSFPFRLMSSIRTFRLNLTLSPANRS